MRSTRLGRRELLSVLTAFIALALESQPAVSLAASDEDTPAYSTAVLVPESHASADASGLLGFAGTGVAASESRAAESAVKFAELAALPSVTEAEGIETIIGDDTRQRLYTLAYPSRAVVLITFDTGRCSGSLIGPDLVLTAGHCVHSGGTGGSWSTGVTVYPGRDGPSSPWRSCGAAWLGSVIGWTQNADERHDYGVVKLNCDIGNVVGWFGFWWQPATLKGTPAVINGYPGDKPLEQWSSVDSIRVSQALQVFYQNDTLGGFSGSSIWQDRAPGSKYCTGPCIMAVHAYGLHGSPPRSTYNHGERITKDRFNNLIHWRNAPK